ncbi:hypothetical protein JYQ62_10605 [Nostoc sp. UHCC 0702]|nr:hypothetical protein JYQ62_10605 [Nostoc sp. UHCC 0702]
MFGLNYPQTANIATVVSTWLVPVLRMPCLHSFLYERIVGRSAIAYHKRLYNRSTFLSAITQLAYSQYSPTSAIATETYTTADCVVQPHP